MTATSTVRLAGGSWSAEHAVVSHPGKGHDRLLCTDGFAGVADGATPLSPGWPDAGDFAQAALESLRDMAAPADRSVREVWAAAIARTAARSGATQPFASCSAAIVRAVGPALEISVLGDCTAIVELVDRRVTLHDPAVPVLDAEVARTAAAGRAGLRLANRQRMNSPGGYWIFAADPAAARHVRSLRVDAAGVVDVLLHTDGLPADPAAPIDEALRALGADRPRLDDDASFVRLRPGRSPLSDPGAAGGTRR